MSNEVKIRSDVKFSSDIEHAYQRLVLHTRGVNEALHDLHRLKCSARIVENPTYSYSRDLAGNRFPPNRWLTDVQVIITSEPPKDSS